MGNLYHLRLLDGSGRIIETKVYDDRENAEMSARKYSRDTGDPAFVEVPYNDGTGRYAEVYNTDRLLEGQA